MDPSRKAKAKIIEEKINRQMKAFAEKYGREPTPNDLIFLDLDQDIPISYSREKLRQHLLETALKSGADPGRLLLQFGVSITEGKA